MYRIIFYVIIVGLPSSVFAHMDLDQQIAKLSQQMENDSNPMLPIYRADMHRRHQNLQLALTDLDRVPSSASKAVHWEAGLQRAQIYHDQKNFLQSQEVLSLILNQPLNPKLKSKALFLQATNFRSLNQPGNSLKSFQESMHLDPSPSPDTALEILIDSFKSDLSQEWRIQFIESALQKLGFVPALFDSLLSIYQAQNAPTLALALIQKWENEFPNPLFLNLEKAILLTQLNEKPKAKEVLNSLILKIEKLPPETKSKQSFQTLLAQAHAQKEQL